MRAVVCEDDVIVRALVSQLATKAGHEVIAETDNALDAVDLIDRFGGDLVLLDLALPLRSGRDVLDLLRDRGLRAAVVVFTAYTTDEAELLRAGALAVIEKPDFGALEDLLATVTPPSAAAHQHQIERRRLGSVRADLPAPARLSPSGVEAPASFRQALDDVHPGDAVLVLRVSLEPAGDGDAAWADLLEHDRRLAIARLVRGTLRVQDRLTATADGELAALLVNGGAEGAKAVFARLAVQRRLESTGIEVGGGWAVHTFGDLGGVTLARARAAAAEVTEGGLAAG